MQTRHLRNAIQVGQAADGTESAGQFGYDTGKVLI